MIERSIKEFLKIQDVREDISVGISNAYSNLNPILRRQGSFYEASNNGEIAVAIADEKQNDRELMRFLHALAETYKFANKNFEASKTSERAFAILESAPDPLLKARLLISKALLSYIHSDYIYIVEYYRRGDEREQALGRFQEVYVSAKKQLEEAEQIFEHAVIILEKDIATPTAELADLYFYVGEYYTIADNWQKSLELFRQAEDTAKTVRNEYREVDAAVGQIMVYYFEGSEKENEQEIQSCKKRIACSKYQYPDLLGKMEIMLGNLAYERYRENKDENDLREAVTKYVTACGWMLAFTRLIPSDRFYATLRILAKRLGDLPPDFLPDRETVESFRDIWNYDLNEKPVCQKYGDLFDEIIDFTLKRIETRGNSEKWKDYGETCRKRHEECINEGKEKLRFVPVYDEMWLRSQSYSGSDTGKAEAHFYLAEAYNVNDNLFEAHKNIVLALECAEKTDDALLKARILARLGQILYRQQEYIKIIEHYRKSDIKENMQNFMRKNEAYISRCKDYFEEAESILNHLPDEDKKCADFVKGHLYFRWAELLVVLNRPPEQIEELFNKSVEAADRGGNLWRQINAVQSLIAHYYFSDQWEEKQDAITRLRTKFDELNEKKYCPVIIARLKIIEGNVKYDQIESESDETLIESAFNDFILATRYKMEYSVKHFYEAVGTLTDRIAKLPKNSVRILYKDVYPRLKQKGATGVIADDAYKLVEQFLQIRSEIL
jgi:tetratricopeptide (TPR) repeat protein